MTPDRGEGVDPVGQRQSDDAPLGLTARQREIADELHHLHPDLGSLYLRGVRLLGELDEPGVPLLVAHIGREVAIAVQDALTDADLELTEEEKKAIPEGAKHRAAIAKMLQLHPNDLRVSRWHRTYRQLTRWSHFPTRSFDRADVRRSFEDLETILYGQVGLYYATKAELDRFLAIDEPDAGDVEALQNYLLRPAQRRYFFGELENPAWVPLLVEAGTYANPPEWIRNQAGWRPRAWPAGEYLARVAQDVPEYVVEVIRGVSGELKNPAVWDSLVTAAIRIPPPQSSEVVPKFCEALQLPTAAFFAANLADLVRRLACEGQEAAFRLASFLLFVSSGDRVEGDGGGGAVRADGRWVLPRLDWATAETLFDAAVPALEAADGLRTLELLLSKLARIARAVEGVDDAVLFWRPDYFDIEADADRPDSPDRLFLETVRVLRTVASRDEGAARRSLRLLEDLPKELGHRLRYVVLAEAGHYVPEAVDEAVRSDDAVRPGPRARELALFLREQYENASVSARGSFRQALKEGPSPTDLEHPLGGERDEQDLIEARRNWTRRRLQWFRGQIPDDLRGIAEDVGLRPGESPSHREQELAEVGFHSAGVSWVGRQSPVEDDELEVMDPGEIVRALSELEAGPGSRREFDVHGLSDSLGRVAASDSDKVLEAASLAVEAGLEGRYLRAFAEGLRQAVEQEAAIDWTAALRFASAAVDGVAGADNREAAHLGSAVAELLNSGFSEDSIPPEGSGAAWQVLVAVGRVEALWEALDRQAPNGFHSVLTMALNHPAGKLARAVFSGVLWLFRALAPEGARLDDAAPTAREAIAEEALPVLEEALEHSGQARAAVEAITGRHLPQLHYVAPDWLTERAGTLLRPGCENPLEHPAWPSFLWSWGYVGPLFEAYRGYYLLAAQSAERLGDAEEDGSGRSVADNLASHLLVAVLRGAAAVGDEDELLETAFANLPPSARSHAYWGVFRAWSDAEETPPSEFVERLLVFWRWRLEQLAKGEGADVREEARGLAWLIRAPYLPEAEVAELGARTVALADGRVRLNTLWERLAELVSVDADAAADIVIRTVDAELASEHPLVSAEEGVPVVRRLLDEVDGERRRALRRMLDRLGEAGFEEFGDLLENER